MADPTTPRRSPRAPQKKQSYHHGDLRRALLDGAFALVQQHGLAELNLRALARKVGVTHAAPYHHFTDRDALIEAMAEAAFAELAREMAAAIPDASDASVRLRALGRVYIDYGRRRPECLELMFRRRPGGAHGGPSTQESSAFDHLLLAVRDCQREGLAPGGDPYALALFAWTLVHGFAALWVEGPLADMPPYAGHFEAMRDSLLDAHVAALAARAREERALR